MQIAFYKAKFGNFTDKIVSAFTFSPYSHCEMVFSDGICASASLRDGGVRFKYINLGHNTINFAISIKRKILSIKVKLNGD